MKNYYVKILFVFILTFTILYSAFAEDIASETIISKGDKLTIKVAEQEDLSGAYVVAPDGKIEFPLLSERITAKGLTYEKLAAKIEMELEKDLFYNATVTASPYAGEQFLGSNRSSGGIVYVYGMVGRAGVVKIPEDEVLTVSKVIIRSGGFGQFANKKKVKLVRRTSVTGKTQTIMLNMVNIIDRGKLEEDVEVRDGDMIVVPEQFFNF